jgi:septum formation protein
MPLVLASASPRRQELLRAAGIEFSIEPSHIAEIQIENETARDFAERMAREKARAVFRNDGNQVVLGADTVVVIDGRTLGKPETETKAAEMLRLLSGRRHEVITGVCLLGVKFEDVRSESTAVYFSKLSEEDIRGYARSGEPMDKAGAYAIQGAASRWVEKIEGDYSNVVGLPVELVLRMLRENGITGG